MSSYHQTHFCFRSFVPSTSYMGYSYSYVTRYMFVQTIIGIILLYSLITLITLISLIALTSLIILFSLVILSSLILLSSLITLYSLIIVTSLIILPFVITLSMVTIWLRRKTCWNYILINNDQNKYMVVFNSTHWQGKLWLPKMSLEINCNNHALLEI